MSQPHMRRMLPHPSGAMGMGMGMGLRNQMQGHAHADMGAGGYLSSGVSGMPMAVHSHLPGHHPGHSGLPPTDSDSAEGPLAQLRLPFQQWMSQHAARLLLPHHMRGIADLFTPEYGWRPGQQPGQAQGMGQGQGQAQGSGQGSGQGQGSSGSAQAQRVFGKSGRCVWVWVGWRGGGGGQWRLRAVGG